MDKRYWPFSNEKIEGEQSQFDRDYVELMQVAFAKGFCPAKGPVSSVELGEWPKGRSVSLVHRGVRHGWEPWLAEEKSSVRLRRFFALPLAENACICVRPPFRAAAYFALEWMRGRSIASLLADFEFVGGYPAGILLRREISLAP